MKIADRYAGMKGKCPRCGGAVRVPKVAETIELQRQSAVKSPLASSRPSPGATNVPAPLTPVHSPQRRKKRVAPPPWVWVAGSGAVVIVILLLVGFLRDGGSSSMVDSRSASGLAQNTGVDYDDAGEPSPFSTGASSDAPPRSLVPVLASVDLLPDYMEVKIARTFDEAERAVVKFEVPQPGGELITGTGFLIDSRGWVATNHHVVARASTAARVKMHDGRQVEIDGIIVLAPESDLAIVQLAEMPSNALLLDIGYRSQPKVGMQVYAYGHPLNNDFSLVKGIVSRVLTTAAFEAQQPEGSNALSRLGSPPDHLWIQTDATVSQGNSGGPLLDEKCRVIGVNTFANLDARFGFASHVKYLKELADRATGEPTPLRRPSEIAAAGRAEQIERRRRQRNLEPTPENLRKLFDAAAALDWKPVDKEAYDSLADLALMLTLAKEPTASFELSDAADRLLEKIKAVSWTGDRLGAINKFAADQVKKPGNGAVFSGMVVCNVVIKPSNANAIIIYVRGMSELLLVPLDNNALTPTPGTRMIVFGAVLPETRTAKITGQPKPWTIRFIRSHNTILL